MELKPVKNQENLKINKIKLIPLFHSYIHFQKKICPKPLSNFVKLVSKILYLFLAEKWSFVVLFVVCCNFVRFWLTFFLIEALIELRKMLLRKKLYHVRFGNCSTPKVPRFCRFTKFTKMQLTQLLDVRSVLDKLFFQNEVQRVLYKLVMVTYPLDHFCRIYSPSNFRFSQKTKKSNLFL